MIKTWASWVGHYVCLAQMPIEISISETHMCKHLKTTHLSSRAAMKHNGKKAGFDGTYSGFRPQNCHLPAVEPLANCSLSKSVSSFLNGGINKM